MSIRSLQTGDPGLEKATIPEVDSVRSGILAHSAENVAERPGAVDTGRDLLNIAGAPGGFPGRPGAAGPPDMNDIRITAGKIATRLRSGCLARKAAESRAESMAFYLDLKKTEDYDALSKASATN